MRYLRSAIALCLAVMLGAGNAFAAMSIPATVSADVNTASEITVSPAAIGFGTIGANITTYRYKHSTPAGVVNIAYVAAGSYEIRVYTDNGVGSGYADARGFIRDNTAVTAHRLYIKLWCPNFSGNSAINGTTGPALHGTSAYTDYLWKGLDLDGDTVLDETLTSGSFSEATLFEDLNGDGDIVDTLTAGDGVGTNPKPVGESASFSYIREFDTHDEGTATTAQVGTRCVLTWNTIGQAGRRVQDGSLGNPFPVILATDLTGVNNGIYTSNNNGTAAPITAGQTAQDGVIFEIVLYP